MHRTGSGINIRIKSGYTDSKPDRESAEFIGEIRWRACSSASGERSSEFPVLVSSCFDLDLHIFY